jgi:hypothetical protein
MQELGITLVVLGMLVLKVVVGIVIVYVGARLAIRHERYWSS